MSKASQPCIMEETLKGLMHDLSKACIIPQSITLLLENGACVKLHDKNCV